MGEQNAGHWKRGIFHPLQVAVPPFVNGRPVVRILFLAVHVPASSSGT